MKAKKTSFWAEIKQQRWGKWVKQKFYPAECAVITFKLSMSMNELKSIFADKTVEIAEKLISQHREHNLIYKNNDK